MLQCVWTHDRNEACSICGLVQENVIALSQEITWQQNNTQCMNKPDDKLLNTNYNFKLITKKF